MNAPRRPLRALIVEDSEVDAELLLHELSRRGFEVTFERVETAQSMQAALETRAWDIVLSDFSLPTFDAFRALEVLKASGLDIPFIVVSGTIGEETAADALVAGAGDFIVKGRLARLVPAIERELREAKIRATLSRTEEQLLHAQKMEAVGRLAGGVAHDINNVLSVILIGAELVSGALAPDDPILEDVEDIRTAGLRATALTRQLLAFSRQQVMEIRVVDLNEVVTGVESMLRRMIGEDVELSTRCGEAIGKVEVDPGQIEQVLMNLAVNARDAMPRGGRLTIETHRVTLDEDRALSLVDVKPGDYVVLSVCDDGTGMDRATQARIFEPFFTTKEQGRGTGLGLSTVFGIVRQCGGHIFVHSEVGVGSTFDVYFPTTDRANVTPVLRTPPVGSLQGSETVLLVEDDEAVRTLVRVVLRKQGYEVLEARAGEDAVRLCREHASVIHLLLTDVVMPRMGGEEIARALRQMRPSLKVLFMSGYTKSAVVHDGPSDSPVAFLQKPITPETLLRKVRAVLDDAHSRPSLASLVG